MQVYELDSNGFYIGITELTEENKDTLLYTTIPLSVGYVKNKLVNDEWIEGATQAEIDEYNASLPQPNNLPSIEERLTQLEVLQVNSMSIQIENKLLGGTV